MVGSLILFPWPQQLVQDGQMGQGRESEAILGLAIGDIGVLGWWIVNQEPLVTILLLQIVPESEDNSQIW